jgi:hypothetical protein
MHGAGGRVADLMLLRFVYQLFASENMESREMRKSAKEKDAKVREKRGDEKELRAG